MLELEYELKYSTIVIIIPNMILDLFTAYIYKYVVYSRIFFVPEFYVFRVIASRSANLNWFAQSLCSRCFFSEANSRVCLKITWHKIQCFLIFIRCPQWNWVWLKIGHPNSNGLYNHNSDDHPTHFQTHLIELVGKTHLQNSAPRTSIGDAGSSWWWHSRQGTAQDQRLAAKHQPHWILNGSKWSRPLWL